MPSGVKISHSSMEAMIEMVRDNPCLWDPSLHTYKDANLVSNVWSSIANRLKNPKMSADMWKIKWRTQRDTYVRKRREMKTKSGQAASRARKWKYMEVMCFLEKYIDEPNTESNFEPAEIDTDKEEEDEPGISGAASNSMQASQELFSDSEDSADDAESQSLFDESLPSTSTTTPTLERKKRKRTPPPTLPTPPSKKKAKDVDMLSKILEGQKEREEERELRKAALLQKQQQQEDLQRLKHPIDLCMDNCALRLKKLSAQTQSVVQMQIQQILFNAENPGLPQMAIMPLPQLPPQQPLAQPPTPFSVTHVQPNNYGFGISGAMDTLYNDL